MPLWTFTLRLGVLTGKTCSGHVRYVVLLSGQRGLDYSACDRFCGRIKVGLCIRRYYTNLCYPSNLKDAVCLIGISVNNNGAAGLEQPPPFLFIPTCTCLWLSYHDTCNSIFVTLRYSGVSGRRSEIGASIPYLCLTCVGGLLISPRCVDLDSRGVWMLRSVN